MEDETGHQTYIPNPEDPEGPLDIDAEETPRHLDIKTTCWWCHVEIEDFKEHQTICPSALLSKESQILGLALFEAEWCDHFCCGMADRICHAKALEHALKNLGWKLVEATRD